MSPQEDERVSHFRWTVSVSAQCNYQWLWHGRGGTCQIVTINFEVFVDKE